MKFLDLLLGIVFLFFGAFCFRKFCENNTVFSQRGAKRVSGSGLGGTPLGFTCECFSFPFKLRHVSIIPQKKYYAKKKSINIIYFASQRYNQVP